MEPMQGVAPHSKIAYHASHEQFSPSQLLQYTVAAEKAGFGAIHSSDHFHPWNEEQGHSGFSFAWLGAAMQATHLPFSMVCAPGQRYHPAIVAQAIATLSEMFPERFSIELGSGEALNESITGEKWPTKPERNSRLKECVDIIRGLLSGENVSHEGAVKVNNAKLYSLPEKAPLLMGAALSEETAEWAGSWADGLITVGGELEKVRRIKEAFRRGGGENKPVYLQIQLSYAKTEEEALNGAYQQWRCNILPPESLANFTQPKQFESAAVHVKPEDIRRKIPVSANTRFHIDRLGEYMELGLDRIILHNVNKQQETFIEDFGKEVLPALQTKSI